MFAVALFALTFPVAELLLEKWGALTLIAVRNVLGFLILLLAFCYLDGIKQVLAAPWRAGLFIGALGFGVGSTLLLIAQSHTNAVTAALAAALMPLAGVGLEMLFDGRRMTRNFLLGTALVLLGSILAIGFKLSDVTFGIGALLGVVSTIVFAWGSRATVKVLVGISDLTRTVVTTAGMALFSFTAFVAFSLLNVGTAQTSFVRLTMVDWGLIVVYAGLALALSQIMWIKGVSRVGIGIASFHLNAAPFYVMLILLALGGGWDWQQASGAALLALGVVLAQS